MMQHRGPEPVASVSDARPEDKISSATNDPYNTLL